jgi:DNA-binding Lrp family transcriptional regulator
LDVKPSDRQVKAWEHAAGHYVQARGRLRPIRAPGIVARARRRLSAMNCVFVQLRCKPGTTYQVADAVYDREFASELYSTSGEWDLIMKVYMPEGEDIGRYINQRILDIPNVERSLTTLTFRAF